jgi:hypothetical protein
MRRRGLTLRPLAALAALVLAAPAAVGLATASAGSTSARRVEIVFTGTGGGRYVDVTRWLRDDTRDCYARRTSDETVAVSWKLSWSGSVVRTSKGYVLSALVPARPAVAGSIKGTTVRDGCDVADDEIDADDFFELVQSVRRQLQEAYEDDTLIEAIAAELEREHGFTFVNDDRLTAAVNVSTVESENFLVGIDTDDGMPDDGRDADYRAIIAEFDPEGEARSS